MTTAVITIIVVPASDIYNFSLITKEYKPKTITNPPKDALIIEIKSSLFIVIKVMIYFTIQQVKKKRYKDKEYRKNVTREQLFFLFLSIDMF